MAITFSPDDPAIHLWQRVDEAEFKKFSHLFDNIPVPVGLIAEQLGLEVLSVTLSTEVSGLIRRTEKGTYQIQVNNTDAAVRQRFTVCHEIAHYLLHRSLIDLDGITDNILYRSKLSNRQEAEANRLGAAILLPWPTISAWHQARYGVPPHKGNIEDIASAFRTSSLAVGFRLGI